MFVLISQEYDLTGGNSGVRLTFSNKKELKYSFPKTIRHIYETTEQARLKNEKNPNHRYQKYTKGFRLEIYEDEDQNGVGKLTQEPTQDLHDEGDLAKLSKSLQKARDTSRVNAKLVREQNRLMNASEEFMQEVLNRIPKLTGFNYKKSKDNAVKITNRTAVIQVTDTHFNEQVRSEDTIGTNVHNYVVASARMRKYAIKCKEELRDTVDEVIVAFTGDLLNSDRRVDEVLTNAGNRSEAFIFAIQVLSKFLCDLAEDYKVSVITVYGNESRMDEDIPLHNPTHNYDFLIHKTLSMMLEEYNERIIFLELPRNWERVINVLGANILLHHGHTKLTLQKAIVKYSKVGIIVHYMITGHLHTTKNEDDTFRSSSTIGGNYYSTFHLNVIGRSAQNIYILEKEDGVEMPSIKAITIDLQNVQCIEGYAYDRDVCINGMRKSPKKGKKGRTIIQLIY